MIAASTASLVVSVAKGLVKLGQRLDALLAAKESVQARLVLVQPEIYSGPSALRKVAELKKYLSDTAGVNGPDPLEGDRAELTAELKKAAPDNAMIGECYRRVFPERLTLAPFKPDAAYIAALHEALPTFDLSNEDNLAAAFSITAGQDDRGVHYATRIGLLVVDVMAEFGAENSGLFVRDGRVKDVVQSVLERFAKPDLENFTEWSPLLRHALNSTLNGVFDARTAFGTDRVWLTALLDVLAAAKDDPASGGDEFLIGLFQGKGYPQLLSKGLSRAADTLAEDQADAFKLIASDLLKTAAPLASKSADFKEFFSDHWGDLLRAGLTGLERHGPALLQDQPELLRDVLTSMTTQLSQIPQSNLLSSDTLFHLGDAAIAAVAAKPKLLGTQVGGKPWMRVLLESFVNTVARDGIRLAFSREGLDEIVTDAAGVFAEYPELIVDPENASLVREVVGSILKSVSDLPSLDARKIATAAASGTLQAIAANPGLLDTRYAKLIADFSGRLAELVKDRTLTGLDATAIASTAIQTLLNNPALFDQANSNLAIAVLNAVLRVAADDPQKLLTGNTLVETIRAVLIALARFGKARVQAVAIGAATDLLTGIIDDSLTQASAELGRRLDLPGLPGVIGGLVAAWARGDFKKIDPATPAFRELLASLLAAATEQAA